LMKIYILTDFDAPQDPEKIGINMNDCEGSVAESLNKGANMTASHIKSTSGMDVSSGDPEKDAAYQDAAKKTAVCGAKAFCEGIRGLTGDMLDTAVRLGLPFALAGLLMLLGIYVCVCMRKKVPGPAKVKPIEKEEKEFTTKIIE